MTLLEKILLNLVRNIRFKKNYGEFQKFRRFREVFDCLHAKSEMFVKCYIKTQNDLLKTITETYPNIEKFLSDKKTKKSKR